MNENKPPPKQYPNLRQFSFRSNDSLAETIETMSKERHQSLSNTIRLLITMGLEQYRNNALSGNTTHDKAQAAQALRTAEAEAQNAIRQRRKRGQKNADPPAIPVIFGFGNDED